MLGSFALFLTLPVLSATYYVDFASGNDASAGTSTGAAWKTIPGTRNPSDSAYVSATYGGGTISTSAKVAAGTVFKLKGGTTSGSANGQGKVLIDSTYYVTTANLSNPITIQRDTAWGSGVTVIDGAGLTLGGGGYGLLHLKVGGVVVDGSTNYGILVANSPYCGISQYPASPIPGPIISSCLFSNNGTTYSGSENASDGNIRVTQCSTGLVSNCKVLGNNKGLQGMSFSDSSWAVTSFTISNCWVQDLVGTENGDGGIGFKGQNSQLTYIDCTGTNCAKAFDHGENDASSTSVQMTYKFINCAAINSGVLGIGLSSAGYEKNFPTFAQYILVNCLVYGNDVGVKSYAGSYSNIIAHCVFDRNGINLLMARDGLSDNNANYCYVWNSIFYKPTGGDGNMDHHYWQNAETIGHYYSDYNSYIQNGSEYFSRFGTYGGGSDSVDFSYGANGPGHASGTWFAFKSWNNDSHSKGTGATDTTAPPFANVGTHDYRLTAAYAGTDLRGKPWYIAEMGKDRAGVTRTGWDMGAYEYAGQTRPAPIILSPPTP